MTNSVQNEYIKFWFIHTIYLIFKTSAEIYILTVESLGNICNDIKKICFSSIRTSKIMSISFRYSIGALQVLFITFSCTPTYDSCHEYVRYIVCIRKYISHLGFHHLNLNWKSQPKIVAIFKYIFPLICQKNFRCTRCTDIHIHMHTSSVV